MGRGRQSRGLSSWEAGARGPEGAAREEGEDAVTALPQARPGSRREDRFVQLPQPRVRIAVHNTAGFWAEPPAQAGSSRGNEDGKQDVASGEGVASLADAAETRRPLTSRLLQAPLQGASKAAPGVSDDGARPGTPHRLMRPPTGPGRAPRTGTLVWRGEELRAGGKPNLVLQDTGGSFSLFPSSIYRAGLEQRGWVDSALLQRSAQRVEIPGKRHCWTGGDGPNSQTARSWGLLPKGNRA